MSASYLLYDGSEYRTSHVAEPGCVVVAMAQQSGWDEARRAAMAAFFQACMDPSRLIPCGALVSKAVALDTRYEPLALEYGLSLWPPERRSTSLTALNDALSAQMKTHRERIRSREGRVSHERAKALRTCAERTIQRYLGLLGEGGPLVRVMLAIEHLEATPAHPMDSYRPCLNEVDLLVSLRLEPVAERYQIGSRVYEGAAFQDLIRPYTLEAQFGCPYASAVRILKWLFNATHGNRFNKKRLVLVGGEALVPLLHELAPASGFATVAAADHHVLTIGWTAPPRWLEPYLRG